MFAGSENEYIKVWDVLGHGEILKRIHLGHHKLIKKVAMSADGFALASADPNGKIIISQPWSYIYRYIFIYNYIYILI